MAFGALKLAAVGVALAQTPELQKAIQQIHDLNERAALRTLDAAAAKPLSNAELAQIDLYRGLAHAGLAQQAQAVAAFRECIQLDPSLRLPSGVSPRIREWWTKAGGSLDPLPPAEVPTPLPESLAHPLPARQPAVVQPPPEPVQRSGRSFRLASLIVACVGIAAVGGGIIAGERSTSLTSRSRAAPDVATTAQLHAEAVHTAQAANVLYGVGGGAGLLGGVGWAFVF